MTVTYHKNLTQGSEEWHAARCGLLTASEMHLIVSPPPEPETRIKKNGEPYKQREWSPVADNDKCRAHMWELLAQRITRYVEPRYISDDMLRGINDEAEAAAIYAKTYAPVTKTGFITNDAFGFTIGYSPDRLVGDDGLLECKSRKQRYQIETIVSGEVPQEYVLQCQTGLLVSGREWLDYLSYSGGLPLFVVRVYQDPIIQQAIIDASSAFEAKLSEKHRDYLSQLSKMPQVIQTKRRIEQEMFMS